MFARIGLALSLLSLGALPGCGGGSTGEVDAGTDARATNDAPMPAVDAPTPPDAPILGDGGPFVPVTIYEIQDPTEPGHVPAGAVVRVDGVLVAAIDGFEENGAGMGHVTDVW